MARQPRKFLGDGFFHAIARGVGKMVIFRERDDYVCFVGLLEAVLRRFPWKVYAYCLMPNHYHLVTETSRLDLSNGMHRLNGLYAQGFNTRYERPGHVFQNRFGARVIEGDDHLEGVSAYVLGNPVRAGLCERAEDWPWSGGLHAWWLSA
jgi:REP element-mobilizing transposase RayT